MTATSPAFLALLFAGALLFHASAGAGWRAAVLAALSASLVACLAPSPLALAPLVGFIALAVALPLALSRWKHPWVLWLGFGALLVLFLDLKRYEFVRFLPGLPFSYETVGLSFVLFRCLHVSVDAWQGELHLRPRDAGRLALYFGSFATLLAGPIQRYEDWLADWRGRGAFRLRDADAAAGLVRAATGIVKIVLVAEACRLLHEESFALVSRSGVLWPVPAFLYLLYVYLNFSGYMDLVIGAGTFFGMRLPENFRSPLAAASFIDLWTRWHVTLSETFRTYVFNPLVLALGRLQPAARWRPYHGVAAYFVVFFLLGVWHGSGLTFAVMGLLLALGTSLNQLWQVELRRRLGPKGLAALRARPIYAAAAHALALVWFAFALIPAWPGLASPRAWWDTVRGLELAPGLAGAAMALVLVMLLRAAALAGAGAAARARAAWPALAGPLPRAAVGGLACVLAALLLAGAQARVAVLYQGF